MKRCTRNSSYVWIHRLTGHAIVTTDFYRYFGFHFPKWSLVHSPRDGLQVGFAVGLFCAQVSLEDWLAKQNFLDAFPEGDYASDGLLELGEVPR